MFNPGAMSNDAQRIKDLGGPTKVASLLGFDKKPGGVQRVHNWTKRGIPPSVRLAHPNLFPSELIGLPPSTPQEPSHAG